MMVSVKRWFLACAGLLVASATPCASAATPKRVLILDSFGRDFAPFNAVVSTFRITLERELREPVEFDGLPLDLGRSAGTEEDRLFVEFLIRRFQRRQPDLVAPVAAPAVESILAGQSKVREE